jgi:DNA gyrase/topoisomerase IV subunit B
MALPHPEETTTNPAIHPGAVSKLADCKAPGPGSGAELFVVEGDSAAAAVASMIEALAAVRPEPRGADE